MTTTTLVPALSVRNLVKTYNGARVVDDISLEIEAGEIFGLLGPNGAGKSSTINLASGVARMESGQIEIFGYDNRRDFRQTRRLTGVMHQEIVIDPFFRVGDALKIHAGFYGSPDDPVWRELLIERLALGPHLQKSMNKLSGGMKRRFMVAKALIHKPRLLILDEPTAGVDVELRRALWTFVREINAQGVSVLLTTHYLEEAEQMCARIAILNQGKVVAMDTTRNLLGRVDRRRIEVRLGSQLTSLPASLAAYTAKQSEKGAVWEIALGDAEETGIVLEKLFTAGVSVLDVQTKTANLEDIFLQLTGSAFATNRGVKS